MLLHGIDCLIWCQPIDALSWHQINIEMKSNLILSACASVDVGICALTVPPMRNSSPATYCMRSCCWQHPSTPMIQPKRMMDTAIPTKPAVILLRSASSVKNTPHLQTWHVELKNVYLNWRVVWKLSTKIEQNLIGVMLDWHLSYIRPKQDTILFASIKENQYG